MPTRSRDAQDALTPANYRAVFGQAVDVLVRPWEHHIRTSPLRFTPLGALRFDRDIRACVAHLAQQTPLGAGLARAAFARLQQIGTVLNLDSDDDANELVASNGWKLTQSEMSTFLALKCVEGSIRSEADEGAESRRECRWLASCNRQCTASESQMGTNAQPCGKG